MGEGVSLIVPAQVGLAYSVGLDLSSEKGFFAKLRDLLASDPTLAVRLRTELQTVWTMTDEARRVLSPEAAFF